MIQLYIWQVVVLVLTMVVGLLLSYILNDYADQVVAERDALNSEVQDVRAQLEKLEDEFAELHDHKLLEMKDALADKEAELKKAETGFQDFKEVLKTTLERGLLYLNDKKPVYIDYDPDLSEDDSEEDEGKEESINT